MASLVMACLNKVREFFRGEGVRGSGVQGSGVQGSEVQGSGRGDGSAYTTHLPPASLASASIPIPID